MADSVATMNVLLGAGGARPAVDVYDVDAGCSRRLIELPRGHSAYAIALDPLGPDGAIVGTKGGRLHWLKPSQADEAASSASQWAFDQGAPVLSTCFVQPDRVAASDSAGRCMLWNRGDGDTPVRLSTDGQFICALLRLEDDTLVGLSGAGAVLSWALPDGSLGRSLSAPPPSPRSALVRLVHWPQSGALVYPGLGGHLVFYDLGKRHVRNITAHHGEFYALFVLDGDLITVGCQDGQLKRWHPGEQTPCCEVRAPDSVISGTAFCDRASGLLLVRENGEAGIFRLNGRELHAERVLRGDYRVAVGPVWEIVLAALGHRRAAEARELATRIKASLARDPAADVTEFHERLVGLRYEHVSVLLRAEQYRLQEDVVGEVRAYRDLLCILPRGASEGLRSVRRYATLLERVWQHGEACSVLRSIAALDQGATSEAERLAPQAAALAGRDVVVQSDTAIGPALAAADVLGKPLTGRYQIHELPAMPCREVKLSADQIVAKYEQVRRKQVSAVLPPAMASQVTWLTRQAIERVDLITFDGEPPGGVPGLQFGLKVLDAGVQSVVAPVVLVDARRAEADRVADLELARRSDRKTRVNSWIGPIHRAVDLALRMLISEALASRRWGGTE